MGIGGKRSAVADPGQLKGHLNTQWL